jgi:hypothetical protein
MKTFGWVCVTFTVLVIGGLILLGVGLAVHDIINAIRTRYYFDVILPLLFLAFIAGCTGAVLLAGSGPDEPQPHK